MSQPRKASSVWADMPFMRGPKGAERLREWRKQQAEVIAQHVNRRKRVMAQPFAHKRLRELGINPDVWNGYIPIGTNHDGRPYDNPVRNGLLALLRDVAAAEAGDL